MKAGMNPGISIGIFADCQYRDANNEVGTIRGTNQQYYNNYRESIPKLREVVRIFNTYPLDFVVHLGDFIDRDLKDADKLHGITKDLKAELWHVIGNHELWAPDTKVEDVVEKYNMPSPYYSKRMKGTRFIMLDTNDLGVLEHPEGSPEWKVGRALLDKMKLEGAINAYHWNGGLGEVQMQWLDDELTDAASHGENAILFAHHPVFPPGILNALNSNEIMDTIDSHDNVTAFINGHNHGGAFGVRKGVPYITMPGMLSGPHNAFGVANLYPDRLEIKGFGRVHDMVIERAD
jgi:3',5'-cyclic AMP phosphodiesterase CpdA